MIGSFGEIVFSTFFGEIQTFDNLKRKISASYAEHSIINSKPKLEFTGNNLDEITMDIKLSSVFGLDPQKSVAKFLEYIENGTINPLIIGTKVFGDFVIPNSEEAFKFITLFGYVREINIAVTFKEYV